MSLSGMKDMSTIEEPPEGRYPVQTYVMEEDTFLIRLRPEDDAASWVPVNQSAASCSPVRINALRRAFLRADAAVPEGLEQRMQRVRAALKRYDVYLSRRTLDLMWRYCAAMIDAKAASADLAFDLAFAQRAMPCILAQAPLECQADMRQILAGMPQSLALLDEPLPIML